MLNFYYCMSLPYPQTKMQKLALNSLFKTQAPSCRQEKRKKLLTCTAPLYIYQDYKKKSSSLAKNKNKNLLTRPTLDDYACSSSSRKEMNSPTIKFLAEKLTWQLAAPKLLLFLLYSVTKTSVQFQQFNIPSHHTLPFLVKTTATNSFHPCQICPPTCRFVKPPAMPLPHPVISLVFNSTTLSLIESQWHPQFFQLPKMILERIIFYLLNKLLLHKQPANIRSNINITPISPLKEEAPATRERGSDVRTLPL